MRVTNLRTASVIFLIISVLPISVVSAAQVKTINVGALERATLTFNLTDGQRLSGSLSITGGGGNDIDFWVTDPAGNRIIGSGRVSGGRSFEFTATQDGAYILNFDNTFSFFSAKTVTLTYDVGTVEIFDVGIPVILYGFVILFVVFVIVVIAYYALKKSRFAPTVSAQVDTVKYCTVCGTQNPANALYCKKCGTQLT